MYLMLLNVCSAPQITPRHCILTNKVQNISNPVHVVYSSTKTALSSTALIFPYSYHSKSGNVKTILVRPTTKSSFIELCLILSDDIL